jgi:hypothetical protein
VTVESHFVQAGDGPILIGSGTETLCCRCGNTLIQGFSPVRFLAIAIQCGRCAAVTTTQQLPDGELPPRSAIVAAPSTEPRLTAMKVPEGTSVVGEAEMSRLQALIQPATPDNTYHLSPALLDQAATTFERHVGAALPAGEARSNDPFAGLREHALGWAVRHLRMRLRSASWACVEDVPTSIAVVHVAGFLHFVATWSRHPLFPAMLTTVADRGFSLHGLAPFAAAHCLVMMGNRINFPEPLGYPGRIETFSIVAGGPDQIGAHTTDFDRFELPFGQRWDAGTLRAAVSEVIGAAQRQINLRGPGVLLLSPGAAPAGYDEALIEAVKDVLHGVGRKNRGLMAVAPIVLRLQALPDPHAVRFGYGFFPIANRHFRGEVAMQMSG